MMVEPWLSVVVVAVVHVVVVDQAWVAFPLLVAVVASEEEEEQERPMEASFVVVGVDAVVAVADAMVASLLQDQTGKQVVVVAFPAVVAVDIVVVVEGDNWNCRSFVQDLGA